MGVDVFLIATDVAGVALNYGTPAEKFLSKIDIDAADRYLEEGHFPAGSMAPKVEAAIEFIRSGGKRAVITSIDAIVSAVKGEAGTIPFQEAIQNGARKEIQYDAYCRPVRQCGLRNSGNHQPAHGFKLLYRCRM